MDIYKILKRNVPTPISYGYFYDYDNKAGLLRDCWCFAGENTGEIILTKFDIANTIISGKFRFSAQCSNSGTIEEVTDGRFDIKLGIYEINKTYIGKIIRIEDPSLSPGMGFGLETAFGNYIFTKGNLGTTK